MLDPYLLQPVQSCVSWNRYFWKSNLSTLSGNKHICSMSDYRGNSVTEETAYYKYKVDISKKSSGCIVWEVRTCSIFLYIVP